MAWTDEPQQLVMLRAPPIGICGVLGAMARVKGGNTLRAVG